MATTPRRHQPLRSSCKVAFRRSQYRDSGPAAQCVNVGRVCAQKAHSLYPFLFSLGNLNSRGSNRVCFGNCLQMALIDRHTGSIILRKRKTGALMLAADFSRQSNEPPARQDCGIQIAASAGSGRAICNRTWIVAAPFDWRPSREERRASMKSPHANVAF